MKKKTKRNPIYIPNSYERDFIGIDFNGKSMKERNRETKIQYKLALTKK